MPTVTVEGEKSFEVADGSELREMRFGQRAEVVDGPAGNIALPRHDDARAMLDAIDDDAFAAVALDGVLAFDSIGLQFHGSCPVGWSLPAGPCA